ncbi:MAG: FAD-dependent monooxygenase [Methylotetracoccus sp.]
MSTFDYDIVIVGGGLAGGSLALALRQTPLRIAVIEASGDEERRASPAGQRALALARGSAQILQQLGVWPQIEDRTTPIRHIHVSDRGHFGRRGSMPSAKASRRSVTSQRPVRSRIWRRRGTERQHHRPDPTGPIDRATGQRYLYLREPEAR